METKKSPLNFVSAATSTNITSTIGSVGNNTANVTQTQIPETARGSAMSEKGYLVEEIRDNLYWVTDGNSITMFMVTDEGVVVVDAPLKWEQNT